MHPRSVGWIEFNGMIVGTFYSDQIATDRNCIFDTENEVSRGASAVLASVDVSPRISTDYAFHTNSLTFSRRRSGSVGGSSTQA